jgi:ribonuclease HI
MRIGRNQPKYNIMKNKYQTIIFHTKISNHNLSYIKHGLQFSAFKSQVLRLSPIIRLHGYTLAFFDGASIAGGTICGVGSSLKCIDGSDTRWYFNCGEGSNNKAELLGAWATLTIAKIMGIQHIQVLGDSRVIVDWLNQVRNLQAINIEGWKIRTRDLASSFQGIIFQHIFRESNEEVDKLSKQALSTPKGRLSYFTWMERMWDQPTI